MGFSDSKTRWQIAFLAGITASFLAACFVLGLSVFTPLVALFILISSFLNKLLAPRNGIGTENLLISNLKQILNVGSYLKILTLAAWIFTVGLISYSLYGVYANKQIIAINGFVETYEGKPADSAFVTLVLTNGKKTTITRGGEFTFPSVDLRNETSKSVTVEVSWNNKVTSTIVDLSAGQPDRLMIKLSASDAPFRVTYYSIGGPALDLLVEGQLDKRWEETLGGQPFIFATNAFNKLRSLVNGYRERPNAGGYFYPDPDPRAEDARETDIDQNKRYFVGAKSDIASYLPITDLRPRAVERMAWNIIVNDSTVPSERFTFWRFANDEELQRFTNSTWRGFYKRVTSNSSLTDGSIIYTSPDPCSSEPHFNLEARNISLRIIVIENTSAGPLNIDNLTVRQNNTEMLRPRDYDQTTLTTAAPEEKLDFPGEKLKPGEKLLVPLELVFAFDKAFLNSLVANESEAARKDLIARAEEGQPLHLDIGTGAMEFKSAKLLEMIRADQRALLNSEYIFGPSMTLVSIRINATEYPLRNYDKKSFVIRSALEIGSCPYIYTYSAARDSWVNEGRILSRKDARVKESTDTLHLQNFHGSILIKEIDPETSYIDSLYVRATRDGREVKLYPRNEKLRFDDGHYLILKMKEELLLDFDIPSGRHGRDYTLVVRGYYVPH